MSVEHVYPMIRGWFLLLLKGMLMGAADVVPGVSGGTIAFITGIYDRLLASISALDAEFFKLVLSFRVKEAFQRIPWGFLLPLLAGIGISIFSLARGVSFLLLHYPRELWAFFFGLVTASTWVVARSVPLHNFLFWVSLILGAVFAYVLVGRIPVMTPAVFWFTFLSGAIASCAMILPGISGSFILVLLSQYQRILEAVKELQVFVLVWFAAGAFVGLVSFSRLLRFLLLRYHVPTMAALCGFMLGSLRRVWPYQKVLETTTIHGKTTPLRIQNVFPDAAAQELILHVALLVVGFFVVWTISHVAGRAAAREKNP